MRAAAPVPASVLVGAPPPSAADFKGSVPGGGATCVFESVEGRLRGGAWGGSAGAASGVLWLGAWCLVGADGAVVEARAAARPAEVEGASSGAVEAEGWAVLSEGLRPEGCFGDADGGAIAVVSECGFSV